MTSLHHDLTVTLLGAISSCGHARGHGASRISGWLASLPPGDHTPPLQNSIHLLTFNG